MTPRIAIIGASLLLLVGCSGGCPSYYWNIERGPRGETGSLVCGSVDIQGCNNAYVLNGEILCADRQPEKYDYNNGFCTYRATNKATIRTVTRTGSTCPFEYQGFPLLPKA